jgi:hypothetical protein
VRGRRGRRRRKLLDDLKKRREYSRLKEEALGRTVWRASFGRSFGPVVRQTAEWLLLHICVMYDFFFFLVSLRLVVEESFC